jgi:hypothetical protein
MPAKTGGECIVVAGMARLLVRCNLRFAKINFAPLSVSLFVLSLSKGSAISGWCCLQNYFS